MRRPRKILTVLSGLAMVAILVVPASIAQAQRGSHSNSSHSNARSGHSSSRSNSHSSHSRYSSHRSHASHGSRGSYNSSSRGHSSSGFGIHLNFGRGHVGVHSGSRHSSHRPTYHHTRHYVPGYYKTVTSKVLVSAGHYDTIHVPAQYGTQFDSYGNACQVVIRPAYYKKVWHPAEYKYHTHRVWVPGCYR